MRCQSGFGSAALPDAGDRLGERVQRGTDQGADSGADLRRSHRRARRRTQHRGPPQISASRTRPERLRLRRSGSPMIGSIAAFSEVAPGTAWSYSSPPLISYDPHDGAKGRGGQLGAREDRHRRGVGAGAGARGPHDDRPRRVRGRTTLFAPHGRRPRPGLGLGTSSPWTAAHRCAAGSKHPPW